MNMNPGPTPPSPMDTLSSTHEAAKAQFSHVSDVGKLISATRAELDKLSAMGDSVTMEDVIKGTGALVAAGADPEALIAMIANPQSPMPEGGEALAGWVKQQDQMVKQREAGHQQAQELAQHQLGVSAMHVLAGHMGMGREQQTAGPSPMAGPNPSTGPAPNPMGA